MLCEVSQDSEAIGRGSLVGTGRHDREEGLWKPNYHYPVMSQERMLEHWILRCEGLHARD